MMMTFPAATACADRYSRKLSVKWTGPVVASTDGLVTFVLVQNFFEELERLVPN